MASPFIAARANGTTTVHGKPYLPNLAVDKSLGSEEVSKLFHQRRIQHTR